MTPTRIRTGTINQSISQMLGAWADEDRRSTVFGSSTGFTPSNGAVRSPDASWLSRQKWNAVTPEHQDGFAPACPEFVIELTSSSDRKKNVEAKVLDEWIGDRAELVWLIEAKERRVTVYRPRQEAEVFEDPVQGTGCVAGVELVMDRVWVAN